MVRTHGSGVFTESVIAPIGTFSDSLTISGVPVSTGDGKLENIVEDLTPQLGGDLDGNGNSITGAVDVLATATVSGVTLKAQSGVIDHRGDLDPSDILNPTLTVNTDTFNADSGLAIHRAGTRWPLQHFFRSRGSENSREAVQPRDVGGATFGYQWDGGTWRSTSFIAYDVADSPVSSNTIGGLLRMGTRPATTAGVLTDAIWIDHRQHVGIGDLPDISTSDKLTVGGTISGTALTVTGTVTAGPGDFSGTVTIGPGGSGDSFWDFRTDNLLRNRLGVDTSDDNAWILASSGGFGTSANQNIIRVDGTDIQLSPAASGVALSIAAGLLTFNRAYNLALDTAVGTKIGTATTQKLGFWGVTPIIQPSALTTALTHITHTAPGTPDYAVSNLVASGIGFATQDEGNTVLSVILNLQTRVDDLEEKLQALGLLP
jgi:hypothetical protein